MFINFNFMNGDNTYAATVAVNQIVYIDIDFDEEELENGETEQQYTLTIHFLSYHTDLIVYKSNKLEDLQNVHSALTSVMAGGGTIFLDDIGFVEPIYPDAQPSSKTGQEEAYTLKENRTLSDL